MFVVLPMEFRAGIVGYDEVWGWGGNPDLRPSRRSRSITEEICGAAN
jgi:hypothetical protein